MYKQVIANEQFLLLTPSLLLLIRSRMNRSACSAGYAAGASGTAAVK